MHNTPPIAVIPVILCGGSGSRLWPLSRAGFPKQFLVLSGSMSLFQQAISRVNALESPGIKLGESLVVTGEEHRFIALDQLREIKDVKASLLLEPSARNTAPALTFAALQAIKNGDDPVLVVTPADQTVQDATAFADALQRSINVAATGSIVILGIEADKPETGYGYIKRQGTAGRLGEYSVAQFTEKPDIETATAYLEAGKYSWNGGMFVMRASVWLKGLKQFRSDILDATEKACAFQTLDYPFVRPDEKVYGNIPSDSIDYAVMEQCPGSNIDIKMVPLDAGWNDLGAWDAVWKLGPSDLAGNVAKGDTLMTDTTNTFVYANSRLVATVGVDNLVVIETSDAVLVADKSQCQNVKKIISQLDKKKREEKDSHRKVYRPWGWYDSIDEGERFKVKRIMVKPGASLSLQMHYRRAEHWIVVKGSAEIVNGSQIVALTENQSTYIPKGQSHRLRNSGLTPLEIIEVQSGDYLGEDDIVRYQDMYGRD